MQNAIEALSSALQGTLVIMGVAILIDREGILDIFSEAYEDGGASRAKSISSFIYDSYLNTSPFLTYYKKKYCEDQVVKKVLTAYGLFDDTAVKNAFELKQWYMTHKDALSQLNLGSWEIKGLTSWENFITLIVQTAEKVSTIPKAALKPGSYGMYLVDKALRSKDIRLLFQEEEYAMAVSVLNASKAEKHKTRYGKSCPIELLGNFEAEMKWRLSHVKHTKERTER